MVDYIEIADEKLPVDEGIKRGYPGAPFTKKYLANYRRQIESGLRAVDYYPEFIDAFQMDILQFFVVAAEEIKQKCRKRLAEILLREPIHLDDQYNEQALFEGMREQQFWELASHYELQVVVDSPGAKSVREINDLRNKLVHEPGVFSTDPPAPKELVSYINSTLDIVEELEE